MAGYDAAVLAGKLQAPGYAADKRPWRQLAARLRIPLKSATDSGVKAAT